jgi:hypothetical protein
VRTLHLDPLIRGVCEAAGEQEDADEQDDARPERERIHGAGIVAAALPQDLQKIRR